VQLYHVSAACTSAASIKVRSLKDPTNWKEYEQEIAEYFRSEYPAAKITPNAHLLGRFSKIERQIDLLVEEQATDFAFRIAVDAKHYTDRIDVKDVEQFLGLLHDVNVDVGVMICPEGYSQAAINRVHYDDSRLELDILNFRELKLFQGFGAIPYEGNAGVLMPAPFGWVIDARSSPGFTACLYQRGISLEDAMGANEWMYVKFSKRDEKCCDLGILLQIQESYMIEKPDAKIGFLDPVRRPDGARTLIRLYETTAYPSPEYTGFVEFEKFIFFCVLFSPVELRDKNLRKLRYILRKVLPLNVRHKTK
jgi:hypothetical protein